MTSTIKDLSDADKSKRKPSSSTRSDRPSLTFDDIEHSKETEYRRIRIYLKIINPILFAFSLLYGFNIVSQIAYYFLPSKSDSIELTAAVIGYNLLALFLGTVSYYILYNKLLRRPYLRWISAGQWLLTVFQFLGLLSVLMPTGVPGRHNVYVHGAAKKRNILGERIPSYTIVTFVIGCIIFLICLINAILICCLQCSVERVKKLNKNETYLLREHRHKKR